MRGGNQSVLLNELHELFYEHADPRIRDRLFMGSPFNLCFFYLCYVVVIVYVIPTFMENRKPFNFTKMWNFVDVLIFLMSGYITIGSCYIWFFRFNWLCQPIDRSDSFDAILVLNTSYHFLLMKFVYTLQSAAYALSKRDSSVATYILMHHTLFPLMIWGVINYYPGGHVRIFSSFVSLIVKFFMLGNFHWIYELIVALRRELLSIDVCQIP